MAALTVGFEMSLAWTIRLMRSSFETPEHLHAMMNFELCVSEERGGRVRRECVSMEEEQRFFCRGERYEFIDTSPVPFETGTADLSFALRTCMKERLVGWRTKKERRDLVTSFLSSSLLLLLTHTFDPSTANNQRPSLNDSNYKEDTFSLMDVLDQLTEDQKGILENYLVRVPLSRQLL